MRGCLKNVIVLSVAVLIVPFVFRLIIFGFIYAHIGPLQIRVMPTQVFTQQKLIVPSTVMPYPTDIFVTTPLTAVVLNDANLRLGPSLNDAIVSTVNAGQTLIIVGESTTGDWYQLDSNVWIAAFLVKVSASKN